MNRRGFLTLAGCAAVAPLLPVDPVLDRTALNLKALALSVYDPPLAELALLSARREPVFKCVIPSEWWGPARGGVLQLKGGAFTISSWPGDPVELWGVRLVVPDVVIVEREIDMPHRFVSRGDCVVFTSLGFRMLA